MTIFKACANAENPYFRRGGITRKNRMLKAIKARPCCVLTKLGIHTERAPITIKARSISLVRRLGAIKVARIPKAIKATAKSIFAVFSYRNCPIQGFSSPSTYLKTVEKSALNQWIVSKPPIHLDENVALG
ncbi:MAG TPA: hypothetical protein V6C95_02985 [Coleofasciculaceae cyanobacterium]